MATVLGIHLVGHNDSSSVTPLPASCYLIEKRCNIFEEKICLLISLNIQEDPEYMEAVFQYLEAKIK